MNKKYPIKVSSLSKRKKISFIIVLVITVFLAIEVISRLMFYVIIRMSEETVDKRMNLLEFFSGDIHTGYRLFRSDTKTLELGHFDDSWLPEAPKWKLGTNSFGFREPDFPVKKPVSAFRIICMGDSSAMGQDVNYDETYCHILASELKRLGFAKDKKIETINLGVAGYSSLQGLITYLKFIRKKGLEPDIVTLAFGPNDQEILGKWGRNFNDSVIYRMPGKDSISIPLGSLHSWGITRIFYVFWSYFLTLCQSNETKASQKPFGDRRVPLDEFNAYMQTLIDKIYEDGAVPAIVSMTMETREYAEALKIAADRNNAPYIVVPQIFREQVYKIMIGEAYQHEKALIDKWLKPNCPARQQDSTYYSRYITVDGYHPGIIGHKVIAKSLAKAIVEHYKLNNLKQPKASFGQRKLYFK